MWQWQLDFEVDAPFDRFLRVCVKKSQKSKKSAKKLGRPEVIRPEKLLDRYKALKQFLENNWGRIGLELQRVHKPDDVRATLKLVPGAEWCRPFRDHPAKCLLADGGTAVGPREIRLMRKQHKVADANERHLSLAFQSAWQRANEATTALNAAISQFEAVITLFPFFFVVALIAKKLGGEELTNDSNRLEASLRQAHKEKQELAELLLSQEGWYARKEIVKFVKNERYEKTAINFARAMAGLPEYGWLHSLRRCLAIRDESLSYTNSNHQLFELLGMIVKKMKRANVRRIEEKLREELLKEDAALLKAFVEPNWPWMKQAITECRGKGFERTELHYKIMGRFLVNVERPKTSFDIELAKKEKLVDS